MTLKEWLEEKRRTSRATISPSGRAVLQVGTQDWLALRLGVDQGLVSKWVRRVTTPERYGTKIVRISKGKVTLPELMRVAPDRTRLSPVDGEP